jgi:tetratricopeptide (TPR) repeat protein
MAEQLDQPTLTWIATATRSWRAQIAGDIDQAEQLATQALQIGTDSGEPDADTNFGGQLMVVSILRGTMGALVPLIEQTVADNPGLPVFAAVLAAAHAEADRPDDARRLLDAFAAAAFELPMDQANWITGMVCYADAAIACRDSKYAGPLFERLAPWADQLSITGTAAALGPISHYLGGLATVLGHYDEADAYFAQSAAMCDRIGMKFYAARNDLWWGRMLAERRAPGDIEKARELLATALTVAAANGYGSVEQRAEAALNLLGT